VYHRLRDPRDLEYIHPFRKVFDRRIILAPLTIVNIDVIHTVHPDVSQHRIHLSQEPITSSAKLGIIGMLTSVATTANKHGTDRKMRTERLRPHTAYVRSSWNAILRQVLISMGAKAQRAALTVAGNNRKKEKEIGKQE
jgi:hypothetical protein